MAQRWVRCFPGNPRRRFSASWRGPPGAQSPARPRWPSTATPGAARRAAAARARDPGEGRGAAGLRRLPRRPGRRAFPAILTPGPGAARKRRARTDAACNLLPRAGRPAHGIERRGQERHPHFQRTEAGGVLHDVPHREHFARVLQDGDARFIRGRELHDLPLRAFPRGEDAPPAGEETLGALRLVPPHAGRDPAAEAVHSPARRQRHGMHLLPRPARPPGTGQPEAHSLRRAAVPLLSCREAGPLRLRARQRRCRDSASDCLRCHEPHGSSNNKRLTRARVDRLCLECHSTLTTATLGSQPPSFHNVSLPRYRNCTTCHVGDPRLEPVAATAEVVADEKNPPPSSLCASSRPDRFAGGRTDRAPGHHLRLPLRQGRRQQRRIPNADQRPRGAHPPQRDVCDVGLRRQDGPRRPLPLRRLRPRSGTRGRAAPGGRPLGALQPALLLPPRRALQRLERFCQPALSGPHPGRAHDQPRPESLRHGDRDLPRPRDHAHPRLHAQHLLRPWPDDVPRRAGRVPPGFRPRRYRPGSPGGPRLRCRAGHGAFHPGVAPVPGHGEAHARSGREERKQPRPRAQYPRQPLRLQPHERDEDQHAVHVRPGHRAPGFARQIDRLLPARERRGRHARVRRPDGQPHLVRDQPLLRRA